MDVESSRDWENLIISESLDETSNEELNNEETMNQSANFVLPSTNLHKMSSLFLFLINCFLLIVMTSGLVITVGPYLEAIDGPSDAYFGLLFISFLILAPVLAYLVRKMNCTSSPSQFAPASPMKICKIGALHGISLMVITFSLDHKKVLCHLQEPLMGLVIVYLIVIYFIYKGPEISSRKMLSLCGLIGGLFLAMDYQLNDLYHCRGKPRLSPFDDGEDWTASTHTSWVLIYSAALFLFTFSWLRLENEILCSKSGTMSLRISTVSSSFNPQNGDTETLLDTSSEGVSERGLEGRPLGTPPHSFIMGRWWAHIGWFLASSFAAILACLWVDFVPGLGKSSSVQEFLQLLLATVRCHFSMATDCGLTAFYGWIFMVFFLGFVVTLAMVFSQSGSMVFTLATASLSLPMSAFWWSGFRMGGPWGMTFYPHFTGEMFVSALGLPVMVGCLCYWTFLDRQERQEANKVLVI